MIVSLSPQTFENSYYYLSGIPRISEYSFLTEESRKGNYNLDFEKRPFQKNVNTMSFFLKLSVKDIFGRHPDLEVGLGEKYFFKRSLNLYK